MSKLIIQSMPNTGSSWFADAVAAHFKLNYRPEFLNPIRSREHYDMLAEAFGCELVDCFDNIARPSGKLVEDIMQETFGASPYDMTKEVFSPMKTASFNRFHEVVIWLRSFEDSFPPHRLRVWSFYEHAWHSLREWGYNLSANTLEDRCREAFYVMQDRLLYDAERLGLPVVWYGQCVGDPETAARALAPAFGVHADALADRLTGSAVKRARPAA